MARPVTVGEAAKMTPGQLRRLSRRERERLAGEWAAWQVADAKENQLAYYRPVSAVAARAHQTEAREVALQGGHRSGKTATMLAEWAIQATGVVPASLAGAYPRAKLRPPIRARLLVTSVANAWDTNLKVKLQWWEWSGTRTPRGRSGDPDRGHWGWVPRRYLLGGEWERSWSEKHRVLTLNRDGAGGTEAGSTLQVVSHETDLKDINQGAFHLVIEDEIPPEEMHRAHRMRVMDLDGQVWTGGTPADDAGSAVASAWFFDQLLAPGLAGTDPAIWAGALWTEDNPMLPPATVAAIGRGLTPEQRRARFHGETLHLAGLIYPGVTGRPAWWCPGCQALGTPVDGTCVTCAAEGRGTPTLIPVCHVWEDGEVDAARLREWPILFYMDPHQSRPTACAWFAVDPLDRWWQVDELEIAGSAEQVKGACLALEAERGYEIVWRKGDPKITAQTNQFAREVGGEIFSIKRAFDEVGFFFEEANTNFTVGRERLLGAFAIDPITRTPRLRLHRRCTRSLWQLTHFVWATPRRASSDLAPKDQPARRHSDFPAVMRYLALDDPDYRQCRSVAAPRVIHMGAGGVGRGVSGW